MNIKDVTIPAAAGEYVAGEFSLSKDFVPDAPKIPVPEWYMSA